MLSGARLAREPARPAVLPPGLAEDGALAGDGHQPGIGQRAWGVGVQKINPKRSLPLPGEQEGMRAGIGSLAAGKHLINLRQKLDEAVQAERSGE